MIWNREYECMSVRERQTLQFERLRHLIQTVYDKIPFYRREFELMGVEPRHFQQISDLGKFPTLTKSDMRDNYPFKLFARPLGEVIRLHASSGTTGKPVVAGYTRQDIETWAEVMARTLSSGGCNAESVVQNAYGYGLFTGGLGAHYGAEKIGATVIPISGGNTKRQITVMQDFGSTHITCTPSYALNIAEVIDEMGIEKSSLKLRGGLLGAEPWTEEMRADIEKNLGISAFDIYGLTEIIGPGVSAECSEKNGLHVFDDHFYPEIIDPDTMEPLPEGEPGELVFSTMTKEAFPLLRYRTRDITRIFHDDCPCGRTHIKMERIRGRNDDMLIIRGVNVFPTQIEAVLLGMEETHPHYHIHVRREGTLDQLEIWIEVNERFFSDEIRQLENLNRKIAREIQSAIGISATIRLVEPRTIERSEGKAKRVTDHRKLNS